MNNTKKIAFTGIFIALILAVGYSLVYVPNVELVTMIIFLSGYFMGIKNGLIVGIVGEFLFSALNPFGSGLMFPPMLVAQLFAMAIVSLAGGVSGRLLKAEKFKKQYILIFGIIGFIITLIYDILVSAAYPISAGFGINETFGVILSGVLFSIMHIAMNVMVFSILLPVIIFRLNGSGLFNE